MDTGVDYRDREGEALALKRLDADLQAGTLRISRTVYNGVVGTPKSKRIVEPSLCLR